MPYVKVDSVSTGIVSATGDPLVPLPPEGVIGKILNMLAGWFKDIRDAFWEMADFIDEVPFIGGYLQAPFTGVGNIFDGLKRGCDDLAIDALDFDIKIFNILSWESIYDSITSIFFDGKSPIDYVVDTITDFIDTHVKPTLDSLGDNIAGFLNYVDNAIDDLNVPTFTEITTAIEDAIDGIELPSWEAVPWLGDLKSWYDGITGDAKDFLDDPTEYISGLFSGLLLSFVSGSTTLLIGIIEAFLDKIWDGYGDSE